MVLDEVCYFVEEDGDLDDDDENMNMSGRLVIRRC